MHHKKQTNKHESRLAKFIKLVLRKPILWQRLAFQRPCLKDVNEGVEGLGTGWSLSVVFHSTTERVYNDIIQYWFTTEFQPKTVVSAKGMTAA